MSRIFISRLNLRSLPPQRHSKVSVSALVSPTWTSPRNIHTFPSSVLYSTASPLLSVSLSVLASGRLTTPGARPLASLAVSWMPSAQVSSYTLVSSRFVDSLLHIEYTSDVTSPLASRARVPFQQRDDQWLECQASICYWMSDTRVWDHGSPRPLGMSVNVHSTLFVLASVVPSGRPVASRDRVMIIGSPQCCCSCHCLGSYLYLNSILDCMTFIIGTLHHISLV